MAFLRNLYSHLRTRWSELQLCCTGIHYMWLFDPHMHTQPLVSTSSYDLQYSKLEAFRKFSLKFCIFLWKYPSCKKFRFNPTDYLRNYKLTLILLTCRIWWDPYNASIWHIGFNSAFKGLTSCDWCNIIHLSNPVQALTAFSNKSTSDEHLN